MTSINNSNDCSKRTASQVNAVLSACGIELKAENQGDGILFSVPCNSLKARISIKKAGFILQRSEANDKICYFKAF